MPRVLSIVILNVTMSQALNCLWGQANCLMIDTLASHSIVPVAVVVLLVVMDSLATDEIVALLVKTVPPMRSCVNLASKLIVPFAVAPLVGLAIPVRVMVPLLLERMGIRFVGV